MVEFSELHVIATISEAEFPEFSWCVGELQSWPSYDDFAMERDGYLLGLSWAGQDVVQVEVPLRSFMRWVELTGSQCSLESLDDFATRRWLRSRYPERSVRLVRSTSTPPEGERGDFLDIPVCVEVPEKRAARKQSDEISDTVLADEIARECLDTAS